MSRLFVDIAKKIFLITILPLIVLFFIYFFILRSAYIDNVKEHALKDLIFLKENISNQIEIIEKSSLYALEMSDHMSSGISSDSENRYNHLKGIFYRFSELYEMGVFLDDKPVFGISKYDIFDPNHNTLRENSDFFSKNGNYYILKRVKSSVNSEELRYSIFANKFFMKFISKISSDYVFFVLNKEGDIIFNSHPDMDNIEKKHIADIKSILSSNGESSRSSVILPYKSPFITLYNPEDFPFILGVETHNSSIYNHFISDIGDFGILIFIFIIAEVVATFVTAKNIAKPINSLNDLSMQLKDGVFKLNLMDIPDNELGDLIINFQSAAERIKNLLADKDAQHEEILSLYKSNKMQLEKLDKLFNSIIDGVYVVNSDMEITYINDAELYFLDRTRKEVIGEKCYSVFYGEQSPCAHCPLLDTGERKTFVLRDVYLPGLGRNDRERIYANIYFVPFGESEYIVSIHDITEINIAYNNLAEKENLLQKIFEASRDAIFLKDTEGVYLQTNNAFDEIFDLPHNFAMGKKDYDIFPFEIAEKFHELDMKILERKNPERLDETFNKYGKSVYLETSKVPVADDDGSIIGILGISRDITRRKHLEMRLQQERDRLLVTLHSIGDGVIVTNEVGKVEMLNTVASQLTGFGEGEAVGKDIDKIFNIVSEKNGEQLESPVRKCIKEQKIYTLSNHTLLINKNGEKIVVADSAAPIVYDGKVTGSVLVFRDETEKRYMLEEIIKKQKLESVGILAGGIAHDFNNILAAVNTYITLLEMSLENDESAANYIDNMKNLIERAKFLSNQLLTFSKGGAPIKKSMNIYSLVKETADFVLVGTNIRCVIEKDDDLWDVDADSNQLSQVIHNILLNARQAVNEKGRITISLKNETVETGSDILPAGNYVKIDITDDGEGICNEHLNRIFEPFYTSKNDGSGLGLSIAYSIIEKHEGHIAVTSEKGKGTTFTMYLKTPEKRQTQSHLSDTGEDKTDATGRGLAKKVLIVDDEKDIRESLSSLLKAMGHECEIAADAETALEKYSASGGTYDIVISDYTLQASISGLDLARKIKANFPTAKIVIMTGYSENNLASGYSTHEIDGFLPKPFSKKDISELMRKIG